MTWLSNTPFGRRKRNGMEWNVKKKKGEYFKNILSFSLLGSLSMREWKDHSLVWELK
jgi:hypothetical protein